MTVYTFTNKRFSLLYFLSTKKIIFSSPLMWNAKYLYKNFIIALCACNK